MKPLLHFREDGGPVASARPAATIVLLRDSAVGLEVFCVERSGNSSFLAGALVFPGGRVDPADHAWAEALGDADAAFGLAALRETLEEAGILLTSGAIGADRIASLRSELLGGAELRGLLEALALAPNLQALVPFSRWVTPEAETKRFDTAFFLAEAPADQPGAHDDSETVASLWATPAELLARFDRGEIAMVPPTHATLEWLTTRATVAAALLDARGVRHAPICPVLAQHEGRTALVLDGDHPYAPRYVLRDGHFVPDRA